jgi:hypothetical protein
LAKGDFFIVFDSDCLIPEHYLQAVYNYLEKTPLDAFGGADKAHESFTDTQKAISYAMTSLLSTGGIRGSKTAAEKFRPRSFNMGISRAVYEKTKGYKITRMGEDIEFSIRIEEQGFRTGFIPEAYVYHKRRTNFRQFYKQLHFFGRGRINIWRFFPKELKLVHCFPAVWFLFVLNIPTDWDRCFPQNQKSEDCSDEHSRRFGTTYCLRSRLSDRRLERTIHKEKISLIIYFIGWKLAYTDASLEIEHQEIVPLQILSYVKNFSS